MVPVVPVNRVCADARMHDSAEMNRMAQAFIIFTFNAMKAKLNKSN